MTSQKNLSIGGYRFRGTANALVLFGECKTEDWPIVTSGQDLFGVFVNDKRIIMSLTVTVE